MARPKNIIPTVQKNLAIEEPLADEIDKKLYDPIKQKVPYGAWSFLVKNLLIKWLRDKKEEKK